MTVRVSVGWSVAPSLVPQLPPFYETISSASKCVVVIRCSIESCSPNSIATSSMTFSGPLDCLRHTVFKTLRDPANKAKGYSVGAGIRVLYSGWPVYVVKQGPQALLTLVFQDMIKQGWIKLGV